MITKFKIYESTEIEKRLFYLSCFDDMLFKLENLIKENPNININAQDKNGWTPLLYATNNCQFKNMKFLIENGADPNIFSSIPKRVFQMENDTVINKLIENGLNLESQTENFKNYFWELMKILLKITDLDKQTNIFKITPLIKVAKMSKSELNSGATFTDKMTIKLINMLVNAGSDFTIKDVNNKDALDYLNENIIDNIKNEDFQAYYKSKKYNL